MPENSFINSISSLFKTNKLKLNKKLIIFAVFFGIATFIWFLWNLEKQYVTVISNPIEISDLPENRVLVSDVPDKIEMEVTGRGFDILKHNWDINKTPLKLSLKSLVEDLPDDANTQEIPVSLYSKRKELSDQMPNIVVNSVIPDQVTFSFTRMITKKLPVFANLELEIEKQYMVKGNIRTIPDSVEISGPASLMDTITRIPTVPLKLRKIDRNTSKNLALEFVHERISLSEKKVKVEIPVEQYTEKNIEVPIKALNVPDSLHMRLFPVSAQLKFRVVVSEFENIKADNFVLGVDYLQISEGAATKLAIEVVEHPEFIDNIKINPETAAFILENK